MSANEPERRLPEVLGHAVPYDDGWISLNRDELRFPDGSTGQRVWLALQFPFVCNVVPVLETGEVVFVEVYRHPVGRWVLELPGGIGEAGETPDEAASRELAEETGLRTGRMAPLGTVNVDPGLLAHETHVFRAEDCTGWDAGYFDSTDQIRRVVKLPRHEVTAWVASGRITHGPTLIALFLDGLARRA